MQTLKTLNEKINLYGSPSWIVNTICKEDLKNYLKENQLNKITDDDMANIAEKLGEALMDAYWLSLEAILDDLKENKWQ